MPQGKQQKTSVDFSINGLTKSHPLSLAGKAIAFISHTGQIRDNLIGAIFANLPDCVAVDFNGQELIWPQSGRIPTLIFTTKKYAAAIVAYTKIV